MTVLRHRLDLRIADLFPQIAQATPEVVWLDSAVGSNDRGSRSLLCLEMEDVLQVSGDLQQATLREHPGDEPQAIPLGELWTLADQAFSREQQALPQAPGWFGWVAYEAGVLADPGLPAPKESLPFPALRFSRIFTAVVEEQGATWLVLRERPGASTDERLKHWLSVMDAVEPAPLLPATPLKASAPAPAQAYQQMVRQVRAHIARGDLYQACTTVPLYFEAPPSLLPHYLHLRGASAGDFGAYIRTEALEIASSSPERFLQIDGNRVSVRPMKGTSPRASTPQADGEAREQLAQSEKDRAENVMIVDLMRNDLGRVCEVGSVQVPKLFQVETYATVHQLTSTIQGQLRAGVGPFQTLAALFPPGSMTGAPKIAACRLLQELESAPRGLYAGSLGWLNFQGISEFNVVIRTLQRWRDRVRWDVGGGIVWDSTPEAEWREATLKAAALEQDKLLSDDKDR